MVFNHCMIDSRVELDKQACGTSETQSFLMASQLDCPKELIFLVERWVLSCISWNYLAGVFLEQHQVWNIDWSVKYFGLWSVQLWSRQEQKAVSSASLLCCFCPVPKLPHQAWLPCSQSPQIKLLLKNNMLLSMNCAMLSPKERKTFSELTMKYLKHKCGCLS